MNQVKHSSAPWSRKGLRIVADINNCTVANVEPPSPALRRFKSEKKEFRTEYDEDMAWCVGNAKVIAAAPDLLEAAQAAWNCIAELPPTQARVEVAQALRVAINKATGEQS